MVNKRHRVCVVSPLYHPSLGGLGRQAQLLTERLAEEDVDIFVIARRMKGMPQAEFSRKVKVYRVGSLKPGLHNFEKITALNLLVSLSFSVSCAFKLFQKQREFDIVHFHGASLPLFCTIPVLKLLKKGVIAKVASAELGIEAGSLKGRYGGVGRVILRLLRMVDVFVATTGEIEEGLVRDGFEVLKIERIPNFIDPHLFTPASPEMRRGIKAKLGVGTAPLVTFSGRFIPRKGINYLLEAWREVIHDFPDAKLLLLGDGPLMKSMKRKAATLGIGGSVIFQGHVHQVTDFLRGTDLFVLPSLQEGMPNSLLEAMACGLPVVATRIGGGVDIISSGDNGILVKPGDSKELTLGILNILKDKEYATSFAARGLQTVRESYSLDSIVTRYLALYERIVPLSLPGRHNA
ncbi:MAG: glycosyltransferase family 4 protein [Deltaproteobacteria bacterium]|nr:glycosyltransferase family 4 protein [Deltaproteobacteria bacterium]